MKTKELCYYMWYKVAHQKKRGRTMCKYCDPQTIVCMQVKRAKPYDRCYVSNLRHGIVMEFDSRWPRNTVTIPAKFCPVCGRKLEG